MWIGFDVVKKQSGSSTCGKTMRIKNKRENNVAHFDCQKLLGSPRSN